MRLLRFALLVCIVTTPAAAQKVIAVANVYCAEDLTQTPFRRVFQLDTDPPNVLNDSRWLKEGVDPSCTGVMVKLNGLSDPAASTALNGTPTMLVVSPVDSGLAVHQ